MAALATEAELDHEPVDGGELLDLLIRSPQRRQAQLKAPSVLSTPMSGVEEQCNLLAELGNDGVAEHGRMAQQLMDHVPVSVSE